MADVAVQVIPAEAVEAAAKVMAAKDVREGYGEYPLSEYTEDVTAILAVAAPHMLPDRKSIAEVLANHQIKQGNRGMTPRCTCGWLGQVFGSGFRKDFIVHQSDMLTVAIRPTP